MPRTPRLVLTLLLAGDAGACYLGLNLGYWARFESPLAAFGHEAGAMTLDAYRPLLLLGTFFLIATYSYLNLYRVKLLLRPRQAATIILRATFFWLVAFLSISLVLKFQPPISRLFVACSCITTLLTMAVWRFAFYQMLVRSPWRPRLVERAILVGWTEEAARLVTAIDSDHAEPYEVVGIVATPGTELGPADTQGKPILAPLERLEQTLRTHPCEVILVVDVDLTRDQLLGIAALAERYYVSFHFIPTFFQIFVSRLRTQTVAGVPIMGYDEPSLNGLLNQLCKRAMDIAGGLVGLVLSAPLIATIAALIKLEDRGPAFFVQERIGQKGSAFRMIKLRSMRLGADRQDHLSQSTQREDPRLLRIGCFIRRWNLDELPQFWNVLMGDMSLVGPRPERTFHANRLALEIPNYASRHIVKPGLTGWAQVNGLRGDTDLVARVKYDLYYIENWSMWLDLQILVLTLMQRKNAY